MSEQAILFSGPMVKAILDGLKTQTRRVVKLRDPSCTYSIIDDTHGPMWPHDADEGGNWHKARCPYGSPGDTLWVRETWQQVTLRADNGQRYVVKKPIEGYGVLHYAADGESDPPPKWRPSIHMPRWASRLTLKVTDVRVEQVQEISEEDVDAEGFGGDFPTNVLPDLFPGCADDWCHLSMPECFGRLWDSINANRKDKHGNRLPYAWADNPWTWAVSFEVER